MRTRIKICGLRTRQAVNACVDAGVDALGFVLYDKSPRAVTVEELPDLVQGLAPWVKPVALFVNPDIACVQAVVAAVPDICLQFHGDESDGFCRQFGQPFLKAARMIEALDLIKFSQNFPSAQAIVADAFVQGYGGGGHVFDWSWLPAPGLLDKPLILSGGLSASNVAQAIVQVRPYAVDVSSGVEVEKAVKSPEKIIHFCRAVYDSESA